MKKTSLKTRIHDGIVGALLFLCVLAFYLTSSYFFLLIPLIVAALMVQSSFTGFCPVYFILDKAMQD